MRRFPVVLLLALSCSSGKPFDGLAPAEQTGGPTVLFDLARKPLPEIPFPNDLAARPDSLSDTGLTVNVPLGAPTQLEQNLRALIDSLDGFGTFAPITVAFDKDLDVRDLFARQNDPDAAKHAIYVVDLTTGADVPLDFNGGHFPLALANPGQYFANDPLSNVRNLLFNEQQPNANFFDPAFVPTNPREEVDQLVTFYERASRTLVIRPVVPLAQERRYAVVLTKRVRGTDGLAIQSPHDGINHAAQNDALQPLLAHLPPGTALSDIAYTWAFTTQSTTRDLELIRQGLYDEGPYRRLSLQYPLQQGSGVPGDTSYGTLMNVLQERGPYDPANPSGDQTQYILPVSDLTPLLNDPTIKSLLLGGDQQEVDALLETFKYVDYFVSIQFVSPSFLDVAGGAPQDQTFRLDPTGAISRTVPNRITLTLAVPKAQPQIGHFPPFPVVIAGHGYKSMRLEPILGFAGSFAKFGLATASIDAYGHGIGVDPFTEATARGIAASYGLSAFADAVFQGRARDLDNDGVKDPGGDFWTADTFHTRDVVRQSIVDWMQLVRLLRTFDGTGLMTMAGQNFIAGDFNGDHLPDVGGPGFFPGDVTDASKKVLYAKGEHNPGGDMFAFGISLGGILSGILPAVEPSIVAAAPVSGAGGLSDVGLRSTLTDVVQAVFLELFGPFFATCNFDPAAGDTDWQHTTDITHPLKVGACAASGTPTLVLVVQDVNHERDIPIAPISLAPGDRVMVQNLAQTTQDCSAGAKVDGCSIATVGGSGLRLPVAADWPSLQATPTDTTLSTGVQQIAVQVLRPGDPLRVTVFPAGGAPQVIDHFAQDTQFLGVPYKAGAPLVAPARGFGLSRNTPEFRRLFGLSQMILEPGDPVNYAPHWAHDLLAVRTEPEALHAPAGPANVLVVGTIGDPGVPVSTAISMARAAGLVELTKPDPDYGMPVDQVLIKSGAVEGVANLQRLSDPSSGPLQALPGHIRCDENQACTGDVLVDVTGYGCDAFGTGCRDTFDGSLGAPRLTPPLREQLTAVTSPGGDACPAPHGQITVGCYSSGPSSCRTAPDGTLAPGVSGLLLPYMTREGQHGFRNPQPQKSFDIDTFMANLIGRYFECRGHELNFDRCQALPSSAVAGGCAWIPPPPTP